MSASTPTAAGGADIGEYVDLALATSTADGCIVIATETTQANLRWANNSLTTNGQMQSRSVAVISTIRGEHGTAVGVVERAIAEPGELAALVADSEQAARTADPAEDEAPLVEPYETDDDWDAAPSRTAISVFADFAPALGQAFTDARSTGARLYGFAEHTVTATYLGSSTGLRRRWDQRTGRVEINGKSDDLTRSAWVGQHTVDFADVDVAGLIADLSQRLDWAERQIELPAGRYETIIPPGAVADLMIYAYWTANARDAEEGRNVFAAGDGRTRIGSQLSPQPLVLRSDPAAPGLECEPFVTATSSAGGLLSVFDNGAPVTPTDWIADGVLTDLIRTRNWAAKTAAEFRAPIDNLILTTSDDSGTKTLDELIAGTERGLLLTCLWYIREVDPQRLLLTGLTRDGVYLVENGEVVGAVNNFRFNESPIDLLGRITEVGRTEPCLPREWNDYFTRTAMPAVRVPDFNMSTVSAAQ